MSAEAVGWVYRYSPYTGDRFSVHLAIADTVNDAYDNRFWMRVVDLAGKARTSTRTAQRALSEMVTDGLLEVLVEAHAQEPREYRFLMPGGVPVWHPSGGVPTGAPRGATVAPLSSYNPREPKIDVRGVPDRRPSAPPPQRQARRARAVDGTLPTDDGYSEGFAAFWSVYPRRIEKKAAWRKWVATCKRYKGVRADLIAAAENYAGACRGRDTAMIKHPATFLGPNEPWKDWVHGDPDHANRRRSNGPNRVPESLSF